MKHAPYSLVIIGVGEKLFLNLRYYFYEVASQTSLLESEVKSLSRVRLLVTPWTAAYQAPPSMGFSRQEYWNGLPLPSPSRDDGPANVSSYSLFPYSPQSPQDPVILNHSSISAYNIDFVPSLPCCSCC